jgi:hypothetical protein
LTITGKKGEGEKSGGSLGLKLGARLIQPLGPVPCCSWGSGLAGPGLQRQQRSGAETKGFGCSLRSPGIGQKEIQDFLRLKSGIWKAKTQEIPIVP